MDKILIPMIALEDIEETIPAMGIATKKGDIFNFDPDNQIHQALKDSNVIKDIPNKECDFYCAYRPILNLGNQEYEYGDQIVTKNLNDTVLTNLTYIGYIKKVIKTKDNNKTKPKKTIPTITYTKLAKELGIKSAEFKKQILEKLGYNIADMRKNVPVVKIRKIKNIFKNK